MYVMFFVWNFFMLQWYCLEEEKFLEQTISLGKMKNIFSKTFFLHQFLAWQHQKLHTAWDMAKYLLFFLALLLSYVDIYSKFFKFLFQTCSTHTYTAWGDEGFWGDGKSVRKITIFFVFFSIKMKVWAWKGKVFFCNGIFFKNLRIVGVNKRDWELIKCGKTWA